MKDDQELVSACRTLWLAVIEQAIHDLHTGSRDAQKAAQRWLRHGVNFPVVCHLAGVDPDRVRQMAARITPGDGRLKRR